MFAQACLSEYIGLLHVRAKENDDIVTCTVLKNGLFHLNLFNVVELGLYYLDLFKVV